VKPFTRLSDGEGTDVERLLLGSAKDDAPVPGVRLRTLAALGLSATAASTVAGAAHAASATAVGGTGAKMVSTASGLALVKWVAIGAVAGVVATGGLAAVTSTGVFGDPATVQTGAAVPTHRVPSVNRRDREQANEESPAVEPEVATPAAVPAARGAVEVFGQRGRPASADQPASDFAATPQGTAFPVGSGDTVAGEVAALDQARSALSAGNPGGALARLDAYERSFPRGALSPEATVLRVRALVQLGRPREAHAVVDAFVRAHPGSAQAARLHALVGEGEER